MTTTTFDPVAYKQTTTQQWQEAAAAWHRWGPTLEEWLGEATELMLDLARIREGSHLLDVAAGAGGQTLAAARRVGSSGSVLATDISSNILEFAAQEARAAGLGNVATQVMDGESLDVEDESVDAVISRVGLIYFPDQQRALAEMRRALREGGRVSAIVYSTPERNQFFSIPVSIIRRRAGLPAPAPGPSRPVQSRPARSPRGGVRGSRLPRGRGARRRRSRPLLFGRRLRPLRAGVVRRAPRDARGSTGGRATGGLGGDRRRATPVRRPGGLRRAVRAPGRSGDEIEPGRGRRPWMAAPTWIR